MHNVGISIVVGVPGSGKSLYVAEDIAYCPGRVVGNLKLKPAHPAYHRYEYLPSEHILQVTKDRFGKDQVKGFWDYPALQGKVGPESNDPGYTIYIDEADIYFDCEEHRQLRPFLHRFLKQHRKRNIRLVFIVQSVENIWVRIRRLAQDVVLCHKDSSGRLGWMPTFMHRFVRVRYATAKMKTPLTHAFMLQRHAKDIYGWYDTSELI